MWPLGRTKTTGGKHVPANLVKDIPDDYLQIIGIEFTVQTYSHGAQELAMFAPSGLIIPRLIRKGDGYFPAITFHSTVGDFRLDSRGVAAPW